jgi:hypothetical protein
MRKLVILVILTIAVLPSVACADIWKIKEGICGEWVGNWSVTETSTNVWAGSVEQRQVGGWCVAPNGAIKTANISVIIAGSKLSAEMTGANDHNNCAYNGSINGKLVTGIYTCPNPAGKFDFSIER